MKNRFKRYLTDLAGVSLIIIAPFLGWLPGPGGIPLFVAGLALLAINNQWAEKLLKNFKDKGQDLAKFIFPSNQKYQIGHDLLATSLICAGITLFIVRPNNLLFLISFSLIIVGLSEFLYNRGRIYKIKNKTLKLLKNIVAFFKSLF